jgi:hypothetical protein
MDTKAPESTVAEFATEHCADCGDGTQAENIQRHIDMMIEAAVALNRTLWKVVIDAEGRVSLLWISLPLAQWEQLLVEAVRIDVLKRQLGLS